MTGAIDLFAGGGGWDIAAKALGIDPLGIEIDAAACATREAAGLRTLQADVADLDPLDFAPAELVIASAPCPTFSSAGKGGGRHLTEIITRCLHELAAGNDTRAERRLEAYEVLQPIYREAEEATAAKKKRDPDLNRADDRARRDADMSLLVVEPLRWVVALKPRFVALEQVPEVLPFWSEMAQILATLGYSAATGVLSAEQFGVPQTRKRAILVADSADYAEFPRPTHQRYLKPPKEEEGGAALFEVARAERRIHPQDRDLLPWISMAEALGWDGGDRIGFPRADDEGGDGYRERDRRLASAPSFAIGEKVRSWDRVTLRGSNQKNATERAGDEPAPTVHFGHRVNEVQWVYDRRQQQGPPDNRTPVPPVPATEPAPTLSANGLAKSTHQWVAERPSTTVNGDPRISQPGRHDPEESGSQQKDAIRVTLEEAAILQSLPPDYPFQGTKSQRFLQIGNAIPPLLAHAILSALLAPVVEEWKRVMV